MATLGQVRSLFSVACVDGLDEVLASCDFEPNNWLNLLPNDEPDDELPLDDEPNMLPPPHPDSAAPAATASAATTARFKRLPPAIIVSSWFPEYPRGPYSRAKTANQRRWDAGSLAG